MANVKFKPGYQDLGAYGMLQPIINAGGLIVESAGDTFTTGIPFNPPPPMLIPSGTRIQYTDGALVGYKVLFYTELSGSNNYYEYLASVENSTGGPFSFYLPFKVTGSVQANGGGGVGQLSPFSSTSLVRDDDSTDIIAVEKMGIDTDYYGGGFDISLFAYDSTVGTTFSTANIWIEFEFLIIEGITPKLIVY